MILSIKYMKSSKFEKKWLHSRSSYVEHSNLGQPKLMSNVDLFMYVIKRIRYIKRSKFELDLLRRLNQLSNFII